VIFIRAKEIPPGSGNWYDYEVETIHKGGKVIQKHIRYLGKHGAVRTTTRSRVPSHSVLDRTSGVSEQPISKPKGDL